MPRFQKKPVIIEAVQLTWPNWNEVCVLANVGRVVDNRPEGCYVDQNGNVHTHFTGRSIPPRGDLKVEVTNPRLGLLIPTMEGVMLGVEGDWIIKGVKGEIYPCKPDIFELSYEPA